MTAPPDPLNTARTLIQQGREFEALDGLRSIVSSAPPLGDRWLKVMQLCDRLGDEDASAEAARQYGTHRPGDPQRALIYAEKLSRIGASDLARQITSQLITQHPNDAAAAYLHGVLASRAGDFEAADQALRGALSLKPALAEAWVQIGAFTNFVNHADDLNPITALTTHTSPATRMAAHFALGKAQDDLGDIEAAMQAWRAGNALMSTERKFDRRALSQLDAVFAACEALDLNHSDEDGASQPAPLFIVGAPRTGTTLTEHILSAHPDVYPLGESLISRVATWPLRHLSPPDLARAGSRFSAALWQMVGQAYTALARNRAGPAAYVTDKAAMLHLFIGALAKALPAARFVWIRRDTEPAALSAYRTYFTSGHAWSCQFEDAYAYLTAHDQLMEKWADRLGSRLLPLRYESLVASPDAEITKLTEFAGLRPDQGPINFHQSKRSVDTASLAQIRQPMRAERAAAWRRYEAYMPRRS